MAKSMTGQLAMFDRLNFEGSPNAISSPASEDGATPCDSPDGPTIDLFGRAVAPVSRSRVLAPKLAGMMRATFGRRGHSSSESAALASSLANRLKARLPMAGSTVCAMTWNEKATPSGRVVSRLRVSGRSISGSGSGSWPTPNAGPQNDTDTRWQARRADLKAYYKNNGFGLTLGMAAQLASWSTPASRDWKDTAGMATTGTNPDGSTRTRLDQLPRQAALASWATPTAHEKRRAEEFQDGRALNAGQALGPKPTGSHVGTVSAGQLNPAHSRWLMGYPREWDDCAATAMQLCRNVRWRSSTRT
jgi:hypothetical protein